MIEMTNCEVVGWEHAIRGMRNPMNSWEKSDSEFYGGGYCVGPNDLDLMKRLVRAGTDHRKFMRMIVVYLDITAPLYWWKEFDTYKIGTVANSCSTMHTIHKKKFDISDFSNEHLINWQNEESLKCCIKDGEDSSEPMDFNYEFEPESFMELTVRMLNKARELYLQTKDKKYWWQMIQLLPSSYNQKRTVMLNYEVLANMYKSRRLHKLDEWREFCEWIESLPESQIIMESAVRSRP